MNDVSIKQQIVEKLTASTNILVTVSTNPSVDALSAALGLTVMLNNLDKHATAVFSGAIPPAITFLDPENTFESTTDSLRDFIIALDKSKADHLRYKVEGEVVKIFITPYRTTITSDDLDFSQGDFNVEMVIALGVDDQSHLDSALEAHGRILHDATVVTLTAGDQTSSLGSIDWHDPDASSLSEMLVGLVEGLSAGAQEPLLDQQTATALLTGIVAETDRFSNAKTSSKVMTVAAQLMAAGADQQLIATKLQESHEIGQSASVTGGAESPTSNAYSVQPTPGQSLSISHAGETLEEITNSVKAGKIQSVEAPAPAAVEAPEPAAAPAVSLSNAYALESEPSVEPLASAPIESPATPAPEPAVVQPAVVEPVAAVTAPAPVEEPAPASHAYMSDQPTYNASMNGTAGAADGPSVDIFAGQPPSAPAPNSAYALDPELAETSEPQPAAVAVPAPEVASTPPVSEFVGERVIQPLSQTPPADDSSLPNRDEVSRDDALAAVHATFDTPAPAAQSFSPAPGIVLPPPPPLPDFSTLPPQPSPDSPYAAPPAERLGDIFAPEPAAPTTPAVPPPAPGDPAQFRIPGQ